MEDQAYYVVGLMSGTSLDGLDIALCYFEKKNNTWEFAILEGETVHYSDELKKALVSSMKMSALELALLDVELGHYFGKEVRRFLNDHNATAHFISSHGHTIFHEPARMLTLQIGNGAAIAANAKIPVVCDFRTGDVALGGQGAPLVPVGDKMLFSEYDFCLNLGGIANISFDILEERQAFDICPANMALDTIAKQLGFNYDKGGKLATQGKVNLELLQRLNDLPFYHLSPPKSLGKEWFDAVFLPLLKSSNLSFVDLLATACEHIAIQIRHIVKGWNGKMLITGGGAWNDFLISRIRAHCNLECVIPDANTVNFKEALVFAFLGVLRWREENNVLSSVTGSNGDSSGGCIYL